MYFAKSSVKNSRKLKVLEHSEKQGFVGTTLHVTFNYKPPHFITPVGFARKIEVKNISQRFNGNWDCTLHPLDGDCIEDILIDVLVLKEFTRYQEKTLSKSSI